MQGLQTTPNPAPEARIGVLEAALAAERALVAKVTAERDVLRASHERLRLELELLRRRLFVAKAERVNPAQLELEFAAKLAELDRLCGPLPATGEEASEGQGVDTKPPPKGPKKKPTGRRDLRHVPLEEERVEIPDPLFEPLVVEGKAERIGYEQSSQLAWKRGGLRRLVLARVKYRALAARAPPRREVL